MVMGAGYAGIAVPPVSGRELELAAPPGPPEPVVPVPVAGLPPIEGVPAVHVQVVQPAAAEMNREGRNDSIQPPGGVSTDATDLAAIEGNGKNDPDELVDLR